MHFDGRCRATLSLAAGILGMIGQERLSLLSNRVSMSASLAILAVSVGLLVFAQQAAYRAGYDEARRDKQRPGI